MHGLAPLMCRSYKYSTEISNLLLSRQIVFLFAQSVAVCPVVSMLYYIF